MRYVIAILAVAGLIVSGLALQVHYSTGTEPCSINERWDCGIVNHSQFAEVQGIPVALIGMAGYALMAWLAMARQRWLVTGASMAGLAYSLYLTHIEKDVLMVWCLYCVISLAIVGAMVVLSFIWLILAWIHREA